MNKKALGSIFLISILIMGFSGSPLAFQKNDSYTKNVSGYINNSHKNFSMMAFAQSYDENQTQTDEHNAGNNLDNSSNTYAGSQGDLNLNDNTTAGVQGEDNQNNNNISADSQGEIENENNNEKAMHDETQQDANNIDDAKKNDTIVAEVDINDENVGTQSIDNNVSVKTEHPTNDTVSITVDASSQTGPKVLLINLNSTTIDVASMKFIDVRYDGNHITPAANVDEVLHPTSSDQPHYAILVTQSGAQILVSIPHFSTHTITVSKINKVMPSIVPEFPSLYTLVLMISILSIIGFSVVSRKYTLSLFKKY